MTGSLVIVKSAMPPIVKERVRAYLPPVESHLIRQLVCARPLHSASTQHIRSILTGTATVRFQKRLTYSAAIIIPWVHNTQFLGAQTSRHARMSRISITAQPHGDYPAVYIRQDH